MQQQQTREETLEVTKRARVETQQTKLSLTEILLLPELWEHIKSFLFPTSRWHFPIFKNIFTNFVKETISPRRLTTVVQRLEDKTFYTRSVQQRPMTFCTSITYTQIQNLKQSDGIISFARTSYFDSRITGYLPIYHFKRQKRKLFFFKELVARKNYEFENQFAAVLDDRTGRELMCNRAFEIWEAPSRFRRTEDWIPTTITSFFQKEKISAFIHIYPTSSFAMLTMHSILLDGWYTLSYDFF